MRRKELHLSSTVTQIFKKLFPRGKRSLAQVVFLDDPGDAEGGTNEAQAPTERFRIQHDWEGKHSLSLSVVTAVSAVTGDAPTTIDPLYEVVDPSTLDELLASLRGDERATVTFSFHECRVTVEATGEIVVQPIDAGGF